MERIERVKELDSIRGLAALVIVFYHLWLQSFGFLGSAVDLFFVLSGYLITTIILTNALGDRFLISFYMRRGLRIWPIYYLTLLALCLIYPLLPPCGNLDDLPYYLTFTQEIPRYKPTVGPSFPLAFRHTWTLAIEEQFYLIWPPLLWWLGKKRVPIVSVVLVALAVVARALNLSAFILITHCDGLALGGLLAGLLGAQDRSAERRRRFRFRFCAVGLGSAALFFGVLVFPRVLNTMWPALIPGILVNTFKPLFLNVMYFALVGTVVLYAGDARLRWLRDRRLVYLGSISYGIYLYHHFIFEIIKSFGYAYSLRYKLVLDVVKVVVSIGAAALSWKYIEQPILSLKKYFCYQDVTNRTLTVPGKVGDVRGIEAG